MHAGSHYNPHLSPEVFQRKESYKGAQTHLQTGQSDRAWKKERARGDNTSHSTELAGPTFANC